MLLKEIKNGASKYGNDKEVISIFFGGGTPSFMSPEYIAEIITAVKSNFNVSENVEITLETNPGTVDRDKMIKFLDAGINRISIGVQSFDNDELKFLTRIHDSQIAIDTIKTASLAGYKNISLDLIFNLPNQTKDIWQSNLKTAVELPITHISTYSLILEKGTILNKMVLDGKVEMQDQDHDADLYECTLDYLKQHDFEQYEVSNFSKPGFECVHNNSYWRYNDYIGFGTSAHSYINGKRWWNYSALTFYLEKMKKGENSIAGFEDLSPEEIHDEYVMLAMRSKGLDRFDYEQRFGESWLSKSKQLVKTYEREGYLSIDDNFIKFTPKGYALCDEILAKIL